MENLTEVPVCERCNHHHRGKSTRETSANQCGFPWVEYSTDKQRMSCGWCGCRNDAQNTLNYKPPAPPAPNTTCGKCRTPMYRGLASHHNTGLMTACPRCGDVDY